MEHIRGLKSLGAVVNVDHGLVTASLPGGLKRLQGAQIILDCPSVGATETILMAAVLAEGTTTIENAAKELSPGPRQPAQPNGCPHHRCWTFRNHGRGCRAVGRLRQLLRYSRSD